jgi:hypothetical protein
MTAIDDARAVRVRRAAARRQRVKRARRARRCDAATTIAFNLDAARKALLATGSLSAVEALDDGNVRKQIGALAEDLIVDWLKRVTL